jgi:hypothetical protein
MYCPHKDVPTVLGMLYWPHILHSYVLSNAATQRSTAHTTHTHTTHTISLKPHSKKGQINSVLSCSCREKGLGFLSVSMSRRFSFFGARDAPSNDETASVSSEKTGSLTTSDTPTGGGDGFFWGKRPSVSVLGLTDGGAVIDENIDELMKNLYQDPDILDKMCVLSAKGLSMASLMDNSKALTLSDAPMVTQLTGPVTINTKTTESVIEELGEEYFTPTFDPVERLLYDVSTWDQTELTEQFMMKIEETDANKDFILGKLADMIEANYGELMACMRDANDINTDLTRAVNQISYGRRQIALGCDLLDKGSIRIAKLQIDRDRQQTIADSMVSLKSVKDLFKTLQSDITTGELGLAAERSCTLLEWLSNDHYSQFRVFEEIGQNVHRHLLLIRQKTDKALKRLCSRKFAVSEYNNLIRSYLLLDYICENLGGNITALNSCVEPQSNPGSPISVRSDSHSSYSTDTNVFDLQIGCVEGLAQRIQRNLFDDIESSLHQAPIEFIYASQQKKFRAAMQLSIQGAYSTMQADEMVDLAECDLVELYGRLTPDLIAPCIVRSCEFMADVVHTHYLITQWHRSPFDSRNEDKLFLHRSANYRDEEEEEETTIQLGNVSSAASLSAAVATALRLEGTNLTRDEVIALRSQEDEAMRMIREREAKLSRLRNARLAYAADKLLSSRGLIWVSCLYGDSWNFFRFADCLCMPVGSYFASIGSDAASYQFLGRYPRRRLPSSNLGHQCNHCSW